MSWCGAVRSVSELFSVPFTRKRKHYMDELAGGMSTDAHAKPANKPTLTKAVQLNPFPPSHYRMTPQQIQERQFPACMRNEPSKDTDAFVQTRPSGKPAPNRISHSICLVT